MNSVICTLIVLSMVPTNQIYRNVVEVKGVIVREGGDKYYVDFGDMLKNMNADPQLNLQIQWINANNCVSYGQ